MAILVLSAADVAAVLSPAVTIESQRAAYRAVVTNDGRLSTGATAVDADSDALVFALTGMIKDSTGLVGKFGVQHPNNAALGLANINAFVFVLDPETGVPLACLNGAAVTTLRTSAGLAVAADVLAPAATSSLGVLGSGAQGAETIRMIASVRRLESVAVWSPSRTRLDAVAVSLSEELGLEVRSVETAREAVTGQDIVATCTLSREPLVHGDRLHPGQTILTMGSYEPDRREIDLATTARGRTFVGSLAKCRAVCGPLIEGLASGALTEAEVTEIGAVLKGDQPGRADPDEILIFHSMGVGYQDAAAGWAAYQGALKQGLGVTVEF